MAPVTRGIADREKDRLVLPARLRERFFAPRIPIDRIVRVLKKVWRLLVREPVCVFGTRMRAAQQRSRPMSLTTLAREIQSGSGSSSYSDQILVIPREVEESRRENEETGSTDAPPPVSRTSRDASETSRRGAEKSARGARAPQLFVIHHRFVIVIRNSSPNGHDSSRSSVSRNRRDRLHEVEDISSTPGFSQVATTGSSRSSRFNGFPSVYLPPLGEAVKTAGTFETLRHRSEDRC